MLEVQRGKAFGVGLGLRLGVDELQLVTARLDERGAGLRADADPVNRDRRREGAIGFDSNFEPSLM